MKTSIKYLLGTVICSVTLTSCVEEQNFDQYDDLGVTPTVEASMLYIEAPESLANDVADAEVISRDFNFDAFSSDIFADRVIDGTVTYVAENTTSKELDFTIELLNIDDEIIDFEQFTIAPASDTKTTVQRNITYGGSGKNINIIKFTSSIRVLAINARGNTTSVSDLPDPKIVLKSSGKFKVRIK